MDYGTHMLLSVISLIIFLVVYGSCCSKLNNLGTRIGKVGMALSIVYMLFISLIAMFGKESLVIEKEPIYKIDGGYIIYTGENGNVPNVYVDSDMENMYENIKVYDAKISYTDENAYLEKRKESKSLWIFKVSDVEYIIYLPRK